LERNVAILANAATQIHVLGGTDYTTATVALSDISIPLTGSMSMGFAVGFMKGYVGRLDNWYYFSTRTS
jgi:hypothetical protein